ncbi:MAG: hypothetical protein RBT45_05920 [Acholeplasmataceae bacterium]|jgi:prenyltransferase beta subunit|nr:hypothetical protein [Acholeplasmataceae bacterium]
MKILDWLLIQDPVIVRLSNKYLLNQKVEYHEEGLIKTYLDLYHHEEHMWGHGIYSPKWISTHYTLLELFDMDINPKNEIYIDAVHQLVKHMWFPKGRVNKYRHQDMCVVAMMLKLLAYTDINHPAIDEMIDYILMHQFLDGGWNCMWESKKPQQSSLHTTLSVIEAFHVVMTQGYARRNLISKINEGVDVILRKKFFRKESDGSIIHEHMASHHYPPRWKYDYFRALEYLATIHYPYTNIMDESLDFIRHELKKGYLSPGYKYPGKIHFVLERKKSAFNTLRALKILKAYDASYYEEIMKKDFEY